MHLGGDAMSRPKKYGNCLNVKTDSDTYQRLIHVSSEAGQTKTVAAERALKAYMDDYDYKQEMLRELQHCDTVMDTAAAEADKAVDSHSHCPGKKVNR